MDDNITQEEKDSVLFKEPLCKYCQVKYLEANKNVNYQGFSKEIAAEILYTNNYINVISPFKHRFAKCDTEGNPIKVDGKHQYPQPVRFTRYSNAFFHERNIYPLIFSNLMVLETHMNAIISNEVLIHYNIRSFKQFELFVSKLKDNITKSNAHDKVKENMLKEVNAFPEKLVHYKNIYVFMDRLSFSELITVYKMCGNDLKRKIFNEFKQRKYTFGYDSVGAFDFFLKHAVQIRNCICHSNSLETLVNYKRIETKEFRKGQSRKAFMKIIRLLATQRGAF